MDISELTDGLRDLEEFALVGCRKESDIEKRRHRRRIKERLTLGAAVDKHHAIADKVLRIELARYSITRGQKVLAYLGDVGEFLECVRHCVCECRFLN